MPREEYAACGRAKDRPPHLRCASTVSQLPSGCKLPRRLGNVGGDRIHQGWRQAVVGFEMQLLQSGPDRAHLTGWSAGLDDRGDKRRELGRRPALVLRKLGVDKIEPVERMLCVLDAAIHVHPAIFAGVTLD